MYLYLCVSTLLNGLTSLVIGIALLSNPKKNDISRLFVLQCLLIFLWSTLYIYPFFPNNESINLDSFRYLHLASNFITVVHFALVIKVLKIYQEQKKLLFLGIFLHSLFMAFIPTSLFIESVVPKFDFFYWPQPGPLYHLWIISWCFFITYPTWLLIKHYRKSIGLRKQQIKGFLIGTLIGLVSGSTNYFLFYNINIPPVLNPVASLYVCSLAYLIARYRFFNLKLNLLVFLHKTTSFIAAFISLYLVYFYVNHFYPIPVGLATDILFVIVALIFYHFFETIINMQYFEKIFRISDHDKFCETLETFVKQHTFDSNLRNLKDRISKTFITDLGLTQAKILMLTPAITRKAKNLTQHYRKTLSKDPFIYSELELELSDQNKNSALLGEIKALGEVVLPIYNSEKKLIAYFILGKKPFENPYYTEEIKILKNTCYYLSLSLSVINYHEDLAKEVAKKTKTLRQRNDQLKDSYKRLQELDNIKDEFLSIASHELRTPLSIIKGYTDFLRLQEFGTLNKKQADFVEKIFSNTNDLITLINKMLDISRLESGQMSFYPEKIQLASFAKEARDEFKIVYDQKKIKLTFSNPKKINPTLFLDKEKLNIIFTNLLGNAYKFTPEGKSVQILIEPYKNQKKVKISVIDEGIGIPKDKQKLVFNKFQQAENHLQKMYSGTGLGLNITKIIIEKFGGEIWVESEDKIKTGCAFIFTLPYIKK